MKITDTTTIDKVRAALAEEVRRATADYEEAVVVDRFFFLPPVPDPDDPVDPADPDGWLKHQRWLRSEIEVTQRALRHVQAAQQALADALAKIAAL